MDRPPIRIPIEPKLAKPQMAWAVIMRVRGSIASAGTSASWMKATNSVSTVLTPISEPDSEASLAGTPIMYISGENIQPRTRSIESGAPLTGGSAPRPALTSQSSASAAISMVAMLNTIFRPSVAPVAKASIVEAYLKSGSPARSVAGVVSGIMARATATAAGAAMKEAASSCGSAASPIVGRRKVA